MSRSADYAEGAETVLDQLESVSDIRLLNAGYDAIDLILDHRDEAEARRNQFTTPTGRAMWQVLVRDPRDDWVIFWWPDGDIARNPYLGSFP